MVVVPTTYDMMKGTFGVYSWTWVNASITAGAMAAIPLLILLLFRFVPILSVTEIEELEKQQLGGTGTDLIEETPEEV
jgi:hypothetical protein